MQQPKSSSLVAVCVLSTLFAGCTAEAAELPPTSDGGAGATSDDAPLRLVRTALRDPGTNNIESHTLLVPEGWRTEGGVSWTPEQTWAYVHVDMGVSAEDGREARFLPAGSFTYGEGPGMQQFLPPVGQIGNGKICMPPPQAPADFAAQFVLPRTRPEARDVEVVSVSELEDVAAEWNRTFAPVFEQQRQSNAMSQQMGMHSSVQTQVWVPLVRLSYTEGGRAYEEEISFAFVMMSSRMDSGFGQSFSTWDWSVHDVRSHRALRGRLDAERPLLRTITASLKPTRRWKSMIDELNAYILKLQRQTHRVTMREIQKRSKMIAETGDEIRAMQRDSWEKYNASNDRINRAFNNVIKDVDDYVLPDGSTQSLDSSYEHVYTDGSDTFLFTDDHLFDPNIGSTKDWTRLEPVQPMGGAANW
ncbi:MAG: hypothetical protein GY711_24205 [bacterium]|nr:hypothetical protein [bacterium]